MDNWLMKGPKTIDSPSTSSTSTSRPSTTSSSSSSRSPPPNRTRSDETADSADENEDHHEIQEERKRTPSKRNFKFRLEWLNEDIFKDWLKKEEKTVLSRSHSNIQEYAHCKICNLSIFPHRNDLVRYLKTEKHSFKARQVQNIQNIERLLTSPHENKIRYAEIKLAALLAARNLPFSLMDDLVEVCGEI